MPSHPIPRPVIRRMWLPASCLLLVLLASTTQAGTQETREAGPPRAALLLSDYVGIPSVTGTEGEAGRFLARVAEDKGLHITVLTDEEDSYNFTASLYPLEEGRPNIILLNHIDVVPAGEAGAWTHPPFSGAIADGFVWGRGSIDNKALGVMQLLALADFVSLAAETSLLYNVTLLSVSNEETGGGKGAALVTERFLDLLNPVAVYGEGGLGLRGVLESDPQRPAFGISVAQKRGLWFILESDSPSSGHGSVPQDVYPTKELVKASAALLDLRQRTVLTPPVKDMFRSLGREERGMRGLVMRHIGFFRPLVGGYLRKDPLINSLLSNTITLTNVGGSEGAHNQIARHAWATFDSRLLPGTGSEAFLQRLQKAVGDYEVTLRVVGQAPETRISGKGPYFHALEGAVRDVYGNDVLVSSILFSAHNDNVFFQEHGIPAYGLVPVILEQELVESIHSVDERMPVAALEEGVSVYRALIRRLAGLSDKQNQ